MIKSSDYKLANNIYLESKKLHPLFESIGDETQAFLNKEQENHPFSDRKIIKEIINVSLEISAGIKEMTTTFKGYFEFNTFEKIIEFDRTYIRKNAFKIVRNIYEDCYYYGATDFEFLKIENLDIIKHEVDDEKSLNTRFTIKEFLLWFKNEGELYASFWLDKVNDELKVKLSIKDFSESTLIKAWELHDQQIKNQDRKILWKSYEKTVLKNSFKLYDFRTAIEYIALSRRGAVKYKLPFFDLSLKNQRIPNMERTYKYGITTNKSVRTVRKK